MSIRYPVAWCAAFVFLLVMPLAARAGISVTPVRTEAKIAIDGRLDEPAWQTANVIRDFVQMIPDTGKPASERTEVRILYDDDKLYFGFTCYDSEMPRAVIKEMRRDSPGVRSGDHAFVFLDAYNDRNGATFFRFNAVGGMEDTIVSDGGNTLNESWDAVWESSGQIESDRWTAELAIPFSQLRFRQADSMTWGMNVGRDITRKREISTWSPAPGGYGPLGKYRPAYFGELTDIRGVAPSRHLEVLPFISPGFSRVKDVNDGVFEAGLDLKHGITSNLTADLTFNTDFAQVEADQQQVNLTRFSLFFPEKRPFFMEGAAQFEFGTPRFSFDAPPPMLLFYSRRIGLAGDRAVPILAGGKVTGQAGPYGIGLLAVATDELHEGGVDVERTGYSVLRLSRNVLRNSSVGMIAVNKQDAETYQRAAGVNFALRPRGNVDLRGLWARTFEMDDTEDSRDAYYAGGEWRTTLLNARASYADIGDAFDPSMGFVWRKGIRQVNAGIDYTPWPRKYGIRTITVGPSLNTVLLRDDNSVSSRSVGGGARVELESGHSVGMRANAVTENIERDFPLFGATIPQGTYDSLTGGVTFDSSSAHAVTGGFGVDFGDFYNGSRVGARLRGSIRPNTRLGFEPMFEHNRISLPDGDVTANLLIGRITYSHSPTMYARLFTQWSDDRDILAANLLLNWIYAPGSDLYFVVNQTYDTSDGTEVIETTALAKLTFWWSL